jgi:hypothetical protein
MKHWDLFPGETVMLRSGGLRKEARFLFRDTKIAAFQMESGEYREFNLRQSGSLRDPADTAEILGAGALADYRVSASERRTAMENSRVWTIEGEDRHTRTVVHSTAPLLESRLAFARRTAC